MVHHADYLVRRESHALCGATLENAAPLTQPGSADAICPDCQEKLVLYHLEWWREKALAATADLDALRAQYPEIEKPAEEQDEKPAGPEPTTLLDHARRELMKLCREFEEAIPYFRLKNAMQAFSDGLESDQRVLLAQEIGASGSLIRWSTTEIETLGMRVLNNPVHEETEAMWEDWVQDSYQVPKPTKRRFGRSR